MRKLLLLFVAILSVSPALFAQKIEITKDGFLTDDETPKDFVVLNFEGVSKEDLYKRTKYFVNNYYNNPKYVSSEIEGEQIVIDGRTSSYAKVIYTLSGNNVWHMNYKFNLEFKDGRLKFQPIFKSLENEDLTDEIPLIGRKILGNRTGVFDQKGNPLRIKGNEFINESVQDFISELKNSIEAKTDDW